MKNYWPLIHNSLCRFWETVDKGTIILLEFSRWIVGKRRKISSSINFLQSGICNECLMVSHQPSLYKNKFHQKACFLLVSEHCYCLAHAVPPVNQPSSFLQFFSFLFKYNFLLHRPYTLNILDKAKPSLCHSTVVCVVFILLDYVFIDLHIWKRTC